MPTGQRARFRHFITFTGLLNIAACSTQEFQLEPTDLPDGGGPTGSHDDEPALSDEPFKLVSDSGGACLTITVALDDSEAIYPFRINGRPPMGEADSIAAANASKSLCLAPGAYDVSLLRGGKRVSRTGWFTMAAGEQFVVIAYGDERQPTMTAAAVEMTFPEAGMRRVRITNVVPDKKPIQLIYYNDADQEIGRTATIAYGETHSSTASVEATYWRLTPTQTWTQKQPVFATSGSSEPWQYECLEASPSGLIVMAPLNENSRMFGSPAILEYYAQHPASCTPDPVRCAPPNSCRANVGFADLPQAVYGP